MKRNPNAKCGNCPYWKKIMHGIGQCRPKAASELCDWQETEEINWCGQHPDFWEMAEITNTCPSCWPTDDAVRTLEWTHVGVQSTTYCPHCGKATTSTFEPDNPDHDVRE